jgi:hypothetical protein
MGSVPSGRREFATTGETEEAEQRGAQEEDARGQRYDANFICKITQ